MKSKLSFKPGGKGHQISRGERHVFGLKVCWWSIRIVGVRLVCDVCDAQQNAYVVSVNT